MIILFKTKSLLMLQTHIMVSNVPPPGSPNPQTIYEFDFESLFGPKENDLDSESRSIPSSYATPDSQNVSGLTLTFPPFDFDTFQPSQVEGENNNPAIESNVDGFQDAAEQFIDPCPNNNEDC